jgi:hypothetical protein
MRTMHEAVASVNGEQLLAQVREMVGYVEQAVEAGRAAHEVEKALWNRVLALGRQATGCASQNAGTSSESLRSVRSRLCERQGEVLACTADGKGVQMRRGAQQARIEGARAGKGVRPGGKKMALLGSVYCGAARSYSARGARCPVSSPWYAIPVHTKATPALLQARSRLYCAMRPRAPNRSSKRSLAGWHRR